MSYKVDNAVIMAAGLSSRFAPISYEYPKALITVKKEVLIERQIRQLQEAGIHQIIVVVGYMKEKFEYLAGKFGVTIIENADYALRNNNSTIWAAKDYIKNTYICSADNYFSINPFETEVDEAYYSALYSHGETDEWCLVTDSEGWITDVTIGGADMWYMLGHVFWSEDFSKQFLKVLEEVYNLEDTKDKLWEGIYREHLDVLKLKMRQYSDDEIYEFDSLDELRLFDDRYVNNSGSVLLGSVCKELGCEESELTQIVPVKNENGTVTGFGFCYNNAGYRYCYSTSELITI